MFWDFSDKLLMPQNGKCLNLVELLRKFDLIMNEHVYRIMFHETHVYYCGKPIQNEIIIIES